jgi:hypothetical protein
MLQSQTNFDPEPQMNFDTHKFIKLLISKGIKEPQAESIVEVVSQSRSYDFSKLATKDQLKRVEERLEGKMSTMEERLEGKINTLEEKMEGKFNALEEKFHREIISVKHDMIKWIVPLLIGILLTIFFKH